MREGKKYGNIIVPMVTPLTSNFLLDVNAVEKIIHSFYEHNISPFILGTTGEAPSLPIAIKKEFVIAASKMKTDNSLLYAGISSNVLLESIDFASFCAANKVDVVVATLPSYYALTNKQMLNYFLQLANNISLPMFIYNIPATTHMSVSLEIIDELSHHKNIVGIKDSERSEERMIESIKLWKNRNDFHYVLGWAAKCADALLLGADGLVPSTGNWHPEIYSKMLNAFDNCDKETMYAMQKLSDEYGAAYQANKTLGESLYTLKILMKEKGLCDEYLMPPL